MSDLVGNPEDRFSRVEAHLHFSNGYSYKTMYNIIFILQRQEMNTFEREIISNKQ